MLLLLPRLNGRADGRKDEDLLGIICKDLEGHHMAYMLIKANKMTTTFLGLRWKASGLPMPKIKDSKNRSITAYKYHSLISKGKEGVHFS